jgi:hypothetical protein
MGTPMKIVNLRCEVEEIADMKGKAKADGLTFSAWLRRKLGLPALKERRGRKKTGRKPASERKRNDTVHRGVGKGNYPRTPRKPKMVQADLFPPAVDAPSSAPFLTSTAPAPSSENTSDRRTA